MSPTFSARFDVVQLPDAGERQEEVDRAKRGAGKASFIALTFLVTICHLDVCACLQLTLMGSACSKLSKAVEHMPGNREVIGSIPARCSVTYP